jgi:hypothetical protein
MWHLLSPLVEIRSLLWRFDRTESAPDAPVEPALRPPGSKRLVRSPVRGAAGPFYRR